MICEQAPIDITCFVTKQANIMCVQTVISNSGKEIYTLCDELKKCSTSELQNITNQWPHNPVYFLPLIYIPLVHTSRAFPNKRSTLHNTSDHQQDHIPPRPLV